MSGRKSLSDSILKELEQMIIQQLKPGDKMSTELELSEQFSVGRSTIRESMKVLSARGLVVRRNEGTFVSDSVRECLIDPLSLLINMEIGNVSDLCELRELLELGTIRIAAKRITPDAITELDRINWQMQEPGATAEMQQARDIEFHNAIARATGNSVLMELLNAIRQVIASNLEDPEASSQILGDSMAIHLKLVDALREHDDELAYHVMEKYFKHVRRENSQS